MNRTTTKIPSLIALILLLALAVIFFHSQLGKTSEESEQSHAQHDFSQLVSRTLPPAQDNVPAAEAEAILLAISDDFSSQERPNFRIDVLAPPYPKQPSLILLFSTLLI